MPLRFCLLDGFVIIWVAFVGFVGCGVGVGVFVVLVGWWLGGFVVLGGVGWLVGLGLTGGLDVMGCVGLFGCVWEVWFWWWLLFWVYWFAFGVGLVGRFRVVVSWHFLC